MKLLVILFLIGVHYTFISNIMRSFLLQRKEERARSRRALEEAREDRDIEGHGITKHFMGERTWR